MPATKRDLDRLAIGGCATPGCTHEDHGTVFLHARCHVRGPIEASYKIGSGTLRIACRVCHTVIADIAVAGSLGATGEPPISQNPNDEGGLNAMLSIEEGKFLKLNFGKSLSFVMMTKEEANVLASLLFEKAMQL